MRVVFKIQINEKMLGLACLYTNPFEFLDDVGLTKFGLWSGESVWVYSSQLFSTVLPLSPLIT